MKFKSKKSGNSPSYRKEEIQLSLSIAADSLDKVEIDKIKEYFDTSLLPGNILNLKYNFFAEYFNVISKFNFILSLLDKASVIKVNTQELTDGKFLIQELLCKLELLEKKYS